MPLVVVTTRIGMFSHEEWKRFALGLQSCVAGALTAPDDEGGTLLPNEIEVRYRTAGIGDLNASPLMVEILANEFPSRKATIQERTEKIAAWVRRHEDVPTDVVGYGLHSKGCGFVWVLLAPGGFALL